MKRLLLSTLLFAAIAFANPKTAPDLPTSGGSTLIDVIVQFKPAPTNDDLKLLGPYGQIKKLLTVINAVEVPLSPSAIQSIANNPDIAYISHVRPVKGSLDVTPQAVTANLAWQSGWDGTGVGVAFVDSGIAPKADLTDSLGLTPRVVYHQSFVSTVAPDDYGHGTHVAGIVAFDSATNVPFYGQSDIFTVEAGYLDINAALASYDLATLPALSPTAVFDSASHHVPIVRNFSVVWGDSVVWCHSLVWGHWHFHANS